MNPDQLIQRYQELQKWIGWTPEDAERARSLTPVLEPILPMLVEDFYAELQHHPTAARVITGGEKQIERLKLSLIGWVRDLLSGDYDREYLLRRWRAGHRHVEIQLEQTFANAALGRLRRLMLEQIQKVWCDEPERAILASRSLSMLLDLDLAILGDAYHTEHMQRLQRQERLAAIGQVAGGIAHEMRNPLNVIQTSLYYLQHAKNPTPEKTEEHLQRMERRVVAANQVITALSRFAKMDMPKLEPFDMAACVADTLQESGIPPEIASQIDVTQATQTQVIGDQEQIKLVLSNLVRNACEAMSGGGRLIVRMISEAKMVRTEVEDNGVGIEAEQLPNVMEPLYTTRARGLGLGLAISKAVVDRHQGEILVTSTLGKGSIFAVRLPAVS